MPSSFAVADVTVTELCDDIIQKFHTDLDSSAVKIDIVLAFRDPEGESPALLKEGHRVWGSSKVISLKDRVKGMGDAEITLDGDAWANMNEKSKRAILDHYLEHFSVKRDKNGDFLFDDICRPIIKLRTPDKIVRLFHGAALRNGKSSYEASQLRSMFLSGPELLSFVPDSMEERRTELDEAAKDLMGTMDKHKATMTVSVNEGEPVEMTKGNLLKAIAKDAKGGKLA